MTTLSFALAQRLLAAVFAEATRQQLFVTATAGPVVGADLAKNPDICLVAGGMPIMLDGTCVGGTYVGGLGVAGGRSEQDQAIAEAALAAVAETASV